MIKGKISIIILSYNTKDLLDDCLTSLQKVRGEVPFKVIVVDNASADDSCEMVEKKFPWVELIRNQDNLGFAKGNNTARPASDTEYILFLNSDTVVYPGVLSETLEYLKDNPKVGALSCRLVLPNGSLDKDARRAFPTPWVSLTRLLALNKLFPKSKVFNKYFYANVKEDEVHEVDVIQGAYFLARKEVLDKVGWFDEDYFLDGEDIDLCWKIHKKNYSIIYYPKVEILHIKGASKGKRNLSSVKQPFAIRLKSRMRGVDSMEIFYRKRMWSNYPIYLNLFVLLGIKLLKVVRFLKILLS